MHVLYNFKGTVPNYKSKKCALSTIIQYKAVDYFFNDSRKTEWFGIGIKALLFGLWKRTNRLSLEMNIASISCSTLINIT